jgi:hypothetical protein
MYCIVVNDVEKKFYGIDASSIVTTSDPFVQQKKTFAWLFLNT